MTVAILCTWPCSQLCSPLSSWLHLGIRAWDCSTCGGGAVLSLAASSASIQEPAEAWTPEAERGREGWQDLLLDS